MTDSSRATSVFINCPFDPPYQPLFEALIFTISYCGYEARSALEIVDSGETRLAKIIDLIAGARFSVHDLSRTGLDATTGLPRFNMPLELGIAIGMKHLGRESLRDHRLLVLDSASPASGPGKFRYQTYASDLAGMDIKVHGDRADEIVRCVRAFLAPHAPGNVAGAGTIHDALSRFRDVLPAMAAAAEQNVDELEYVDRLRHISAFIARTKT